ncbi:MAG: mechanosensitive ion channel [Bacillota bacterium]|nr:mechanosensitive ion channel [Bacillota bacterium]
MTLNAMMDRLAGWFHLGGMVELGLIIAIYVIGAIAAGWLAGRLWTMILGRIAAKAAGAELDTRLVIISRRPVAVLVFILILQAAKTRLSLLPQWVGSPVFDWLGDFIFAVGAVAAALWLNLVLCTVIDWYLHNIAHRTQTSLDELFLPLARKVLAIVIYFLALTVILSRFDINITGLIATAGVASLALALAAQDTLSNMLAGFMILTDRPFREGDRIEINGGMRGDVLHIGLRSTKILSREGKLVIIPNKDIANSTVINHVLPDSRLRLRIPVGVAYGTDLHRVKEILFEILENHPKVLKEPQPVIWFTEFAESSLNLLIRCWIEDARDQWRVTDGINMSIKERFEQEGIEIPFPQRDIHLFMPEQPRTYC